MTIWDSLQSTRRFTREGVCVCEQQLKFKTPYLAHYTKFSTESETMILVESEQNVLLREREVSIISWHLPKSKFSVRFATFGRVTLRFECNNSRSAGRIFVKYGIVISQQELPLCSGFDINGKRVTGTSYQRVLRACIHCEYKRKQVLNQDTVITCVYRNIIHVTLLILF